MNLCVPTNFDPKLIEELAPFPVQEVYGKLQADVIGGGRSSSCLPAVRLKDVIRHATLCRKHGIRFNYLLNAAHSDNIEMTRHGQKDLERLVRTLDSGGVADVTVATPYLLRWVKKHFPHFRVKISVFAQVGDVRKAKQWEDMGADEIVLDSMLVNREFPRLLEIRKALSIPLCLFVNNNCHYGCALSPYHMNLLASSSRNTSRTGGFLVDYCYLHCTALKIRHPANFLTTDWIRPEDLHLYEEIGYDVFKLAGRNLPTDTILHRVRTYHERRYAGNLLDLVQDFGIKAGKDKRVKPRPGAVGILKWLLTSAPLKFSSLKRILSLSRKRGFFSSPTLEAPAFVDNRSLDGFMEKIIELGGCRDRLCNDCQLCFEQAKISVRINRKVRDDIYADQIPLLDDMESGAFWFHDRKKNIIPRTDIRMTPFS